MKVSRQQAAANHERIVEEAAKLFRERGFNGIGVADLMKSVGLTHGGFYGQFASKEDLMAQAAESLRPDPPYSSGISTERYPACVSASTKAEG